MAIYFIFFFSLIILMFINKAPSLRDSCLQKLRSHSCETESRKPVPLSFVTAAFLVALFSALRFNVGWDYSAYYDTIAFNKVTNIVLNKEYITIFLIKFAQTLSAPQLYFILNSLLTIGLITKTATENTKDYWISLLLFVSFPLFFLNSLSVVRNFSAISLTFYGYKYIKSRAFLKYLLIVVTASFFHKSALIALLFYFTRNINLNKWFCISVLISMPFLSVPVLSMLNNILIKHFPQYISYAQTSDKIAGTKAIFLLFFIGVAGVLLKEKLERTKLKFSSYFNPFFVGLCIYLAFYKQGTLGHRLSLYGTIYSLLVLPDLINLFKSPEDKVIIKSLFFVLCFVMFFYTIAIGRATYIPYKTFFMN